MNLTKTTTGITSYGTSIPRYRITIEEIARTWHADPAAIKNGLGLIEKSVPALDEDTITVAVNAAIQAYKRLPNEVKIGAIYTGSESHPYAVKPTSVTVGEALGIGNDYTAADIEFACKAGSAGMQMAIGLVDAGRIEAGIAIGADTAQGAPGDALEYSAACGAAAFIIGQKNVIAKLIHTTSFSSDTPDFWRREHEHFPSHGGRFTGEPAYFKHVSEATKKLLNETGTKASDYDHVVFHMPNGKFPLAVAKMVGVNESQLTAGLIVPRIGNTYSACSMIGLASVLDVATPGEKILVTSYGSGSGSDSFAFEVTKEIKDYREKIKSLYGDSSVDGQLNRKKYLTYGEYVRHTKKLKI